MFRDFPLILASLKSRTVSVLTSVLLVAFGVCLCLMVIQFSRHVTDTASRDAGTIDLVITAKGSPLQAVLSSVYHIDIPIANIPQKSLQTVERMRDVTAAVPLALGDSYRGFRIVGTTHDFLEFYGAKIADGAPWDKSFEAVAGANTGLKVGDQFAGVHGFASDGHAHEDHPYIIVGVLAETGTVADRLILTSVQSVQDIHADHDHDHDHEKDNGHKHDHQHDAHDHSKSPKDITAILVKTRTPLANINIPRSMARDPLLMASNPAYEMVRITTMLGFGQKTLMLLAFIVMALSLLSIFAGMIGAMETRLRDIAVLRALGYQPMRIAGMVMTEGMILGVMGVGLGFLFGLLGFNALIGVMAPLKASGAAFIYDPMMLALAGIMVIGAGIAALIPAYRVARLDVAKALASIV